MITRTPSIFSASEVSTLFIVAPCAGGRTIASGPNAGIGSANPYKSALVGGFTITAGEKADVIAFLRSLTDSTFLTRTRLSNPWIVP